MKFSIEDLVTFTEENLNGKFHFLCSLRNCFSHSHYNLDMLAGSGYNSIEANVLLHQVSRMEGVFRKILCR